MRVRVFEETSHTHYGRRYADWQARCDCGEGLHAGDWGACMTWACGHQAFAHARALSPSAITTLLRQIELDRKTAYWGTPPHSHSLDGAESWLLSLQDWLGGTR